MWSFVISHLVTLSFDGRIFTAELCDNHNNLLNKIICFTVIWRNTDNSFCMFYVVGLGMFRPRRSVLQHRCLHRKLTDSGMTYLTMYGTHLNMYLSEYLLAFSLTFRVSGVSVTVTMAYSTPPPHCIAGTEDNSHLTQESLIGLR